MTSMLHWVSSHLRVSGLLGYDKSFYGFIRTKWGENNTKEQCSGLVRLMRVSET